MEMSKMSPRRPHLLRAFYNWFLENELTPHILVDVTYPGVVVPMDFARDGQIVLNIAPRAVDNLELNLDYVHFDASFSGVSRQITVPMASILAVYARENNAGMMFEPEPAYDSEGQADDIKPLQDKVESTDALVLVADSPVSDTDGRQPSDDDLPPPRGGRPTLRVVK